MYPRVMAEANNHASDRHGASDRHDGYDAMEMLATLGITVTEEGKARARARLAGAEARQTPELRAAMRAQVGLIRSTRSE
jgi:hypothetical protein